MDSGVISKIPAGSLISFVFFDWFASPCHLVMGKSIFLHKDSTLENWSLIRAFSGEMYTIFTAFSPLSAIWEIIGRKAASVFPPAVWADKITSLGELIRCRIASF